MIPVMSIRPRANAEPRGGAERRATGVPAGWVKRWGRGDCRRVAALLAVGLAVAALLTAGPVHAQQTPIVPDLSGTRFVFTWYDNQYQVFARGYLAIHGVDVYTGNFTGYLQVDGRLRPNEPTGAVTGQILPQGITYAITFTVSSPTDLWTYYNAVLFKYDGSQPGLKAGWYARGQSSHTDPRDPDFYDPGYWDAKPD
jgi:hypothetical protein